MDRWKDGWKDGQTLFYRTLPTEAGGPIRNSHAALLGFKLSLLSNLVAIWIEKNYHLNKKKNSGPPEIIIDC